MTWTNDKPTRPGWYANRGSSCRFGLPDRHSGPGNQCVLKVWWHPDGFLMTTYYDNRGVALEDGQEWSAEPVLELEETP